MENKIKKKKKMRSGFFFFSCSTLTDTDDLVGKENNSKSKTMLRKQHNMYSIIDLSPRPT